MLKELWTNLNSSSGLLREIAAMRTLFSLLALLTLMVFGVVADPPADKEKDARDESPLQIGKDLPGTFHPYNVTGTHAKHFHCLISEHGLDPMVMIFHKGMDFGDPLRALVEKLDAAIEKNPDVRLASFVVFLPDELAEVAGRDDKSDDARLKLAESVAAWGEKIKLKHVVLCLDSKADVEKYKLNDANLVTVVLYQKFEVAAVFALPGSELETSVDKILTAVADKLGAKRK